MEFVVTVLVLCILIFCLLGWILLIIFSQLSHLNKRVIKVESQLVILKAKILSGVNLLGVVKTILIFCLLQ